MLNSSEKESQSPISRCLKLIDSHKTLLLSTYSEKHGADISYAPYVRDDFTFYVYVSELARHTGNLLSNQQGAVMFIQPEAEAGNPFARERVIFDCRAMEIPLNQPLYDRQLEAMQQKFGETVSLLRTLNDFHLLQLHAESGHYVAGFGQAYALDLEKQTWNLINKAT